LPQRRHHLPRVEWKGSAQVFPICLEHSPVVGRIAHKEQQNVDRGISALERKASVEGLDVSKSRLGFDWSLDRAQAEHAVPRSEVAVHRQWHLRSNVDIGRQSGPKSAKEVELWAVERWARSRDRTCPQSQADGNTGTAHLVDRQSIQDPALDAAQLRM
jgi:hypothetical protein